MASGVGFSCESTVSVRNHDQRTVQFSWQDDDLFASKSDNVGWRRESTREAGAF